MLEILKNRTYRHLFLAQVVALLGTGLATVALSLLAFDLAGDKAGQVVGTAMAIKMVATVGQAKVSIAPWRITPIPPAPTNPSTVDSRILISQRRMTMAKNAGMT